MEYPISELLDRYTIAKLKMERIGEVECRLEFDALEAEIYKLKNLNLLNKQMLQVDENKGIFNSPINLFLETELNQLYEINGKIWDMESQLRAGLDGEVGLEEIGRRAIEIRNLNRIRVGIKNRIAEVTGSGYKDIKMNHVSEYPKEQGWVLKVPCN